MQSFHDGTDLSEHPYLILFDGNFLMTMRKDPVSALAVQNGTIRAIGNDDDILGLRTKNTRIIDLEGRTVVPGFNDAHTHFLSMGVWLSQVNLEDVESIEEVIERLAERAKKTPKNQWILGHGWDEHKFKGTKRYPDKHDLDRASKEHPILIVRICGHMSSANSLALQLSNPPRDIEGIDINPKTKELSGLLFEGAAKNAVYNRQPTLDEMKEGLRLAIKEAHRLGVTSVTDFVTPRMLQAYQELYEAGELKLRVGLSLRCSDSSHEGYPISLLDSMGIRTNFGNETIKITSVKLAVDGSLGAHTALLSEPYADDPEKYGTSIEEASKIEELTKRAHCAGFQVAIHAIGDRALDHAIQAIKKSVKAYPRSNHRHRIEHCELTSDEQLRRMRDLAVVASMQPNFIGVWGREGGMYEKRLGRERLLRCNMYRQMLDRNIPVCFGSDGMPFNPLLGIWSAVTHPVKTCRLTVEEALRCYTVGSAYASFDERLKGTLEIGKVADLAVLSHDLSSINPETIRDVKVEMTISHGEIVYRSQAAGAGA